MSNSYTCETCGKEEDIEKCVGWVTLKLLTGDAEPYEWQKYFCCDDCLFVWAAWARSYKGWREART